ncbi:MAG: lipase family alpha/beta hydrolase [Planctomycetota bacterium]|jgi:pimeloyl-ACP methyl ester carboxylesterase
MAHSRLRISALLAAGLASACSSTPDAVDLGELYDQSAQGIGDDRIPVVVIPGILGSKLSNPETGQKIWGSFTYGAADADYADGAREIALPMGLGVPLSELEDGARVDGALDYLVADIGPFRNIKIGAYVEIMLTLAVGQYRDQGLGESGAVDYGGQHYTCYQYPYDWRRDISESAAGLHAKIEEAQARVREARGLADDYPVRVDVVAHSMGGLVLRYYLRYGAEPLPEDGSVPEPTWAGAEHVERAFLIGTPSGGSVSSLRQLIEGLNLNPVFPNYRPSILGTMPAVYQLLPRVRHGLVRDRETGEAIDFMDVATWEQYGWGLANPDEDDLLQWLLPEVESAEERRRVALDHLAKCLAKTDQLYRALDAPASPPENTEIYLFAGDGVPTASVLSVSDDGKVRIAEYAPGDDTVTRDSALMDERVGRAWTPGLDTPVAWDRIQFINASHIGLTQSTAFADNLLFMLLEQPRITANPARAAALSN